jgi:hypothetical protein
MFEYQISVSLNGRFLFRTDWINGAGEATNTATVIKSSMPLAKVTIARRNATMLVAVVNDDLTFKF